MLELETFYENYNEQFIQDNARRSRNAAILAFPYKFPESTIDYAPMTDETGDIVSHRMKAPLNSSEMAAVLDMIKRRAKRLEQALWVTTQSFLATMGVEELGDLCRRDFVSAVNYLVNLESALDASAQIQSVM